MIYSLFYNFVYNIHYETPVLNNDLVVIGSGKGSDSGSGCSACGSGVVVKRGSGGSCSSKGGGVVTGAGNITRM